jgi:hypothetical protein
MGFVFNDQDSASCPMARGNEIVNVLAAASPSLFRVGVAAYRRRYRANDKKPQSGSFTWPELGNT